MGPLFHLRIDVLSTLDLSPFVLIISNFSPTRATDRLSLIFVFDKYGYVSVSTILIPWITTGLPVPI